MDVGSRVEGEATQEVWAEKLQSEGKAIAVKVRGWGLAVMLREALGSLRKTREKGILGMKLQ